MKPHLFSKHILKHKFWVLLGLVFLALTFDNHHVSAQTCSSSSSSVLAEWNMDTKPLQCNGYTPPTNWTKAVLSPQFDGHGGRTYCPNINNGCGNFALGSRGFQNSRLFENAICLQDFWYNIAPGWDPASTTFSPSIPGNLFVHYIVPSGKAGKLTGFSIKYIQKQYAPGKPANFVKQGVGVYRNGVLIHTEEINILPSNVNATPITFTFPDKPEFSSDGTSNVTFEITFGLVQRLVSEQTGYDDIRILGTCGGSPSPTASISQATCGASSANADGKITLSNFGANDKFDYSVGSTYTGGKTYATATDIPSGGVIVANLANPTTPQTYTVRVFTAEGCTVDLPVTLDPSTCPGVTCTKPTATVTASAATCSGASVNLNASIAITGVSNGDKVGISQGTSYNGSLYGTSQALSGGSYTFSNLANPSGGSQAYTIRVYNGNDGCFQDYPVTLTEADCGCKKVGIEIIASNALDADSSPNNGLSSEDDFTTYEVCKGNQYIDLKLTKTVSPTTGTTCPVNTSFVWTLTLTNEGTMTATDIQVADELPNNLNLISGIPSVGTFTSNGAWILPSLAAGASATLTLTTQALTTGTFQNCAWVNSAFPKNDPDSSPDNTNTANEDDDDCASITVTGNSTPIVVKEFSPKSGGKPNVPFRVIIKIENTGSTPITLTQALVDILPSTPAQMTVASSPNMVSDITGIIATAGGTSITVPSGTVLQPGLSQIAIDLVAPSAGTYCNTIGAGDLKTTNCDNILGTETCITLDPNFVLGPMISKSMLPTIVAVGQNSTLTLTIDNRNSETITLLQDFKDTMPDGVVLAGTPSGTCPNISTFGSTNEVGITTGAVLPSGKCTITVPVSASTEGYYCNEIPMNALVGNVNTTGGAVMTGNEDYPIACLTVSNTPLCTAPNAGPDITVCLPKTTANFVDASAGYTWVAVAGNPVAAAINATTGVVSGMTAVGTYRFRLQSTTDSNCYDEVQVTVTNGDVPIVLCNNGSTSYNIVAPSNLTNVIWYNMAGTQVGTGTTLTVTSNTTGLSDGSEAFYYIGVDGTKTGCDVELCCPVKFQTQICCPVPNCVGVTVIKN